MGNDIGWPYDEELHVWWVEPGRLLAGEYPSSKDAAQAQRKLDLLVEAGVDSIVDLTTSRDPLRPYDSELKATAEKAGRTVRHYSYPIPDMGVIDDAGYDAILAVIRDELDAGRIVYVHCWGGKGRTTTVIGCLLADTGLDYDAVITRIAALRSGTKKATWPCPESPAQRDVIRRRCDRVREQNW